MKTKITCIAALASALVLSGCAAPNPTIQQGPDAEVSFDGLHRVDHARFKLVYADPDIDFTRYNKIMPGGSVYEFRAVKKKSSTRATSSDTEFWISDKARAQLEQETTDIFREEIAKSSRFTTTDVKGPDVLMIRGALHDVVSNVPPEQVGRADIYLSQVAEATLIIEGVDSMSNAVVFRLIERRAAERAGGTQAVYSSPVTTWAEVRRLLRRWATTFREGLDAIPTS